MALADDITAILDFAKVERFTLGALVDEYAVRTPDGGFVIDEDRHGAFLVAISNVYARLPPNPFEFIGPWIRIGNDPAASQQVQNELLRIGLLSSKYAVEGLARHPAAGRA